MTSEQILAHEELLNYETVGDLPDTEAFEAACKELLEHERLADRYRKLIDECQHHENCRHSLTKLLEPLSEEKELSQNDD